MDRFSEVKFEIGEKYANEKGPFEVMSIKGDRMRIKFDTGEEINSNIDIQRRIQERIIWEKTVQEKKLAAASQKSRRAYIKKTTELYPGLQEEIFQNKKSTVKWRVRDQLGGSVASHMPETKYKFNSWADSRRNEIHWADTTHWKKKETPHPAKFFAGANETNFAWGFYIERPDDTGVMSKDWDTFNEWLKDESNDKWLRDIALEHNLEIYDNHKSCFSGVIKPRENDWLVEGSSIRDSVDRLGTIVNSWKRTAWMDLMIAKRITKKEAIDRAEAITHDITALFEHLLPLYAAATSHLNLI